MTSSQPHRNRVVEVMAEILEIDSATIHGTLRLREDLGMDSLGSLELLSVISQELHIEIEMDETLSIRTVDDACAFVERHFREQHEGARAGT
jgi:acyl carrier protein